MLCLCRRLPTAGTRPRPDGEAMLHPALQAEIARIESVGGWVDDGRVCGVLAVSRCAGCRAQLGLWTAASCSAAAAALFPLVWRSCCSSC